MDPQGSRYSPKSYRASGRLSNSRKRKPKNDSEIRASFFRMVEDQELMKSLC